MKRILVLFSILFVGLSFGGGSIVEAHEGHESCNDEKLKDTLNVVDNLDISELKLASDNQSFLEDGLAIVFDTNTFEIKPRRVGACAYGDGICDAVSRGWAKVFTSQGKFRYFGGSWQCTKCKTQYVTENDPGVPIGQFNSWQASSVMPVVTYFYSDVYTSTNLTYIPGVRFRYQ